MSQSRLEGFKKYSTVDEALVLFLKGVNVHMVSQEVSLKDSLSRVLAEDVLSAIDVPSHQRSAMDGYAVKADDTYGASPSSPAILEVIGKVQAGHPCDLTLSKGQSITIMTGGLIPKGADGVVMLEHTRKVDNRIEVLSSITPGKNVVKVGEDTRKNQLVLRRGTKLRPYDIGLLSGLGTKSVKVVTRPKVAILSTGDEIVEPGEELEPGQVYDMNRGMLTAMVMEAGGEAIDLGIAADDFQSIRKRLSDAILSADLVLVSAGTSAGELDLVPDVINSLGKPGLLIHGVAMRPGSPTGLGVVDGKPVVLLPGFPVACIMAFYCFGKPIIHHLLGTRDDPQPVVKARSTRKIASSIGMRTFARIRLHRDEKGLLAEPLMVSGAGILTSMTAADGITIIPENKEGIEQGEEIDVILLRPLGD